MKHVPFLLTSLCALLVFSGCKKSGEEPSQPQSSKDFYIQATIDNQTVLIEADKLGSTGTAAGAGYISSSNSEADYEWMAQSGVIEKYTAGKATNTLSISQVKKVLVLTYDNRDQWKQGLYEVFKVGDYAYGRIPRTDETTDEKNYKEGTVIEYYDENGKEWSTYLGSAIQTGSTFKITSVVKNTDPISAPTIKQIITADFSCTLYSKEGATKKLTGGKLKLLVLTHPDFRADD